MNKFTDRKGFTLIELLVVIGIIGVLAAVLYASFGAARDEAKNKAMQTELRETQLSLELYKAQNDNYPADLALLKPEFIADIPDAGNSGNTACSIDYTTLSSQSAYKLTAVECHAGAESAAEGVQVDDQFARCPTTCSSCTTSDYEQTDEEFYTSYAVYSFGGQCE
jgi:prepilin-type N-terminal cleavage/methylation domain-containing protein